MNRLLTKIKRACFDYNMIKNNEMLGIGVSGGKDSMFLVDALSELQKILPEKFKIEVFVIDPGLDIIDTKGIQTYFNEKCITCNIMKTDIAEIVFNKKKESNPCSLCSRMRRGAICKILNKKGIKKLVLAHHLDDAISTLFLCMFYEGRISTFSPVTYLSRQNISVIRPLIYIEECSISNAVTQLNIPVFKSKCKVSGKTKREFANKLLKQIGDEIPYIKRNLLCALKNKHKLNLWF